MKSRDTFIFYRSIYESAQNLSDADKLAFYEAVIRFSLDFEDSELDGLPEAFFALVRPVLDKSNKGYIAGMRTPTKMDPPRVPKRNPDDNKDKDKDKDKDNKKNKTKKWSELSVPQWVDSRAWEKWCKHRREIKKTLTPSTVEAQLKFLDKRRENHILIIEQSIQNGWTGLFDIGKKFGSKKDPEVKFENFMEMKEHLAANFEKYKGLDIDFEGHVWKIGKTGIAYSKENVDDMPYDQRKRFWIFMINNKHLLEVAS